MRFGLQNVPVLRQQALDIVQSELNCSFALIYPSDVVVHSKSIAENL